MGKYLARGHGVRTWLRSVRTPRPRAKYFPIRPDLTYPISILSYDQFGEKFACTVRHFPAPLAQMRTALIRDFHQWFCQGRAGHMIKSYTALLQSVQASRIEPYGLAKIQQDS